MSAARPLRERPVDWPIVAFYAINLVFITYMVDLEQLVIRDPSDFEYPAWPPAFVVDLVHGWGRSFDPVLLERPVWWKMTIWIDQLFFGPFYAFALYAFIRGRNWIRLPAIVWAAVMLTNVTIILGEEVAGSHPSPALGTVLLANAGWVVFPVYVMARMWRSREPFAA